MRPAEVKAIVLFKRREACGGILLNSAGERQLENSDGQRKEPVMRVRFLRELSAAGFWVKAGREGRGAGERRTKEEGDSEFAALFPRKLQKTAPV